MENDRTLGVLFCHQRFFQKSCFVSRGSTAFDIFRGGVPPVETDTGESIGSGRRMGPSTVSLIAD